MKTMTAQNKFLKQKKLLFHILLFHFLSKHMGQKCLDPVYKSVKLDNK
jgi:hypothetical protein